MRSPAFATPALNGCRHFYARKRPNSSRRLSLQKPHLLQQLVLGDRSIHECPMYLSSSAVSSEELKKVSAEALSGAFRVALSATLLSTQRSEPSVTSLEDTTLVVQKHLTAQQRALVSLSPVPYQDICQLHSQRTNVALFFGFEIHDLCQCGPTFAEHGQD